MKSRVESYLCFSICLGFALLFLVPTAWAQEQEADQKPYTVAVLSFESSGEELKDISRGYWLGMTKQMRCLLR